MFESEDEDVLETVLRYQLQQPALSPITTTMASVAENNIFSNDNAFFSNILLQKLALLRYVDSIIDKLAGLKHI
uniref:Uncharacterized protein n=1 Tax=Anopheles quadriannulatus TaxID=34691 RepID=A0A182XQ66_ANOQN